MHRLLATALLCGTFAIPARAEQELILSAGKGLSDILIQKDSIAGSEMYGVNYAYRFAEYPMSHGLWQWWAQGSYSHLSIDYRGRGQNQDIFELKPVLRWYPGQRASGLFAEAGVGAAYLSEKNFGQIELTTHGNFALHFAAGYRLRSGCAVSVRYSHFSNAYTNTPNPGFDFGSINWHFSF
ncbi:acyloxyacyl hydrolase [Microbulbifer litoralis]|uniref:acyloxyacyl hydrolase n=1 Tax=Microbulbifer litoralis TaxID=2933965 RepID=UPI0020289294|nr:acyloxyacyl hydrolase [Microbulbifer sp. GX H0434]